MLFTYLLNNKNEKIKNDKRNLPRFILYKQITKIRSIIFTKKIMYNEIIYAINIIKKNCFALGFIECDFFNFT